MERIKNFIHVLFLFALMQPSFMVGTRSEIVFKKLLDALSESLNSNGVSSNRFFRRIIGVGLFGWLNF